MKTAYLFPGQGAQHVGMGKSLYDTDARCRDLFEQANDIMGFRITDLMFGGTPEDLRQTRVTQPALFLHSVILAAHLGEAFRPDMVAGHSLGEFSALTAAGALGFEDGLRLVVARANAMQQCCEKQASTMVAVVKLDDATVERLCAEVSAEGTLVVPANYNTPGQVVVSGTVEGATRIAARVKELKGRALPLAVGGAFHSPLMEPARVQLAQAIEATAFRSPCCPCYQNVTALPATDPAVIRDNLVRQLTAPVRWTASMQAMAADGADRFVEVGPGTALQGMAKRICPEAVIESADPDEAAAK